MIKYRTNLSKFPKEILKEAKHLLEKDDYEITVATDHGFSVKFNDEGKEINTSLVFNNDGNLLNYTCNCEKYSLCKHVGAALMLIEDKGEEIHKKVLTLNILNSEFNYRNKYFHTTKAYLLFLKSLIEQFTEESIAETMLEMFKSITFSNNGYFLYKFFDTAREKNLPVEYYNLIAKTLKKIIIYLNTLSKIKPTLENYLFNFFLDLGSDNKGNNELVNLYFECLDENIKLYSSINSYLIAIINATKVNTLPLTDNIVKNFVEYKYGDFPFGCFNLNYLTQFIDYIYKSNLDTEYYILKLSKMTNAFSLMSGETISTIITHIASAHNDYNLTSKLLENELAKDSEHAKEIFQSLPNSFQDVYNELFVREKGIYNFFPFSTNPRYPKFLEQSNEPISFYEIINLLNASYPFLIYPKFFNNKEIIHAKPYDNKAKDKLIVVIDTLLTNLKDKTFKDKIVDLLSNNDSLKKTIISGFDSAHIDVYIKLGLLEEVGFIKI